MTRVKSPASANKKIAAYGTEFLEHIADYVLMTYEVPDFAPETDPDWNDEEGDEQKNDVVPSFFPFSLNSRILTIQTFRLIESILSTYVYGIVTRKAQKNIEKPLTNKRGLC